jgi:hypothetical protein
VIPFFVLHCSVKLHNLGDGNIVELWAIPHTT